MITIIYFCDSGGRDIKVKFCCVDVRAKESQDPRLCWHRGPIDLMTARLEQVATATKFENSKPGQKSWGMLMTLIKNSPDGPVGKDWQETVVKKELTVRPLQFARIETA